MKERAENSLADRSGGGAGIILREAFLIAAAGFVIALAANAISPRGLRLSKDYFPRADGSFPATLAGGPAATAGNTNHPAAEDPLAAQIHARGLQAMDGTQAERLFRDPRYLQERVVFIDARNEEHYRSGHIPRAFEFDVYRTENNIAAVLPACMAAEVVMVYCNGGECEDSQFAAVALREAGIENRKLFVYSGGIKDWTERHLPVEAGGAEQR